MVVDGTDTVKMYNKDGTLSAHFCTVLPNEVGKTKVNLQSVAIKKDGVILVGDVKRCVLTEHSPFDGSLKRTIKVIIPPQFLAVASNDRVVMSGDMMDGVVIVDDNGAAQFVIKPTIKGEPVTFCYSVCCDSSSGIYIAVGNIFSNEHIHHYDAEGSFLSCIAQGMCHPKGITFTADRRYLAVADASSLKMYTKV